jgi:hypothetical protein
MAMPHGFVSKAHPRLRTKYAHKEARKTPGGPKVRYRRLPQYVNGVSAGYRTVIDQ